MPEQEIQQIDQGTRALAQYTADDGTKQVISLADVRYWFCERATPADAALFAARCQAARLNPFAGDASLVKYGDNPASVLISKDSLVKRADRMSDYRGMDHGVVFANRDGEVKHRRGQATYKTLGETLLGAWCEVYRDGRKETYAEVALDEYNTGKSLWRSKPAVMIDKVAQATALRLAYPQEFSGAYDAAEIDAPESPNQPMSSKPPARQITDEDRQELAQIAEAVGDKQQVWHAYVSGGMQAARDLLPSKSDAEAEDAEPIEYETDAIDF